MLFLLPRPEKQQPVAPQYDGPSNFDDLRESASQLRARLDDVRQSLSAISPSEGIDLEPALDNVRQRAEMLRRNVCVAAEPSPDSVEMELENIRRRLELLRQHVGSRPD